MDEHDSMGEPEALTLLAEVDEDIAAEHNVTNKLLIVAYNDRSVPIDLASPDRIQRLREEVSQGAIPFAICMVKRGGEVELQLLRQHERDLEAQRILQRMAAYYRQFFGPSN